MVISVRLRIHMQQSSGHCLSEVWAGLLRYYSKLYGEGGGLTTLHNRILDGATPMRARNLRKRDGIASCDIHVYGRSNSDTATKRQGRGGPTAMHITIFGRGYSYTTTKPQGERYCVSAFLGRAIWRGGGLTPLRVRVSKCCRVFSNSRTTLQITIFIFLLVSYGNVVSL